MSGPGFPSRFPTVKDKTVLSATPCELITLRIRNGDAAVRFLQLFDAATTGAVTLGTTVPIFTVHMPSNATTPELFVDLSRGLRFSVGIVAAVTTTETGNTLATLDSVTVIAKS